MTNFLDGSSGDSDLVFSAFDTTAGVGYTFDLAVALNSILSADNASTGTAIAANSVLGGAYTNGVIFDGALADFSTFLSGVASLSDVEWNLAAADSSGRSRVLMTQGDTASTVTMNNSKVAYVANSFLNYTDAVVAKVGTLSNFAETTTADNAAFAGGSTWGSTGGIGGVVDNTNVLSDGSSANLYLLSQTSTVANKGGITSYSAEVKDANGTPLVATVYQDAGIWKLKVQAVDNVAPTVGSVDYGTNDGSLHTGESINFVVNFSENVNVAGGTPTLTLDNGATATYVSGTGTGALTFSYTPTEGDAASADLSVTAFNLGTATVKDAAGNNADTTAAISNPTGTVTVDAIAPTVTTFSPADEAVNVAGSANIVVNFSEAIAKGAGNIIITNAAGATVESFDVASSSNVTVSGSTLTINPTNDLANAGAYTVSFDTGSIKDIAGNNYAGGASYNFTTTTFQNGTSGNGDLVFSAWDNFAGKGYTLDLGIALNSILGADNGTTGAVAAANATVSGAYANGVVYEGALTGFESLLNGATLSNIEWNLAAADSSGRARVLETKGDTTSVVSSNNSKVATTVNDYNNYLDAVAAKTGQGVNPVNTQTSDNAAYAGGATWGSNAGVASGLDTSLKLSDNISGDLYLLSQSNTLGNKGGLAAYSTQVTGPNGAKLVVKLYTDDNGVWQIKISSATIASGTSSADTINGTDGDDNISAGIGNDVVITGIGNDTVKGDAGNDTISGGAGRDSILGGDGNDLISGGDGKDYISGDNGNDTLIGDIGDDTLSGGTGDDSLVGGLGNDYLDSGLGLDTLVGGVGNDTYVIAAVNDVVTENANEGNDTVLINVAATGSYVLADNVETGVLLNTVAFDLTGNALNNSLKGNIADNVIDGGAGIDTYSIGNATSGVVASLLTGTSSGGAGNDTILNIENLTGTNFNDTLIGDTGNNTLSGGTGDDSLVGGLGNDNLTGGAGNDMFVFNTAPNATTNIDTINDFVHGSDQLRFDTSVFATLSGATASTFASGAGKTTASDADTHLIYNTSNGALYYDADGVGGSAAVKIASIVGHPVLDFSDLSFIV